MTHVRVRCHDGKTRSLVLHHTADGRPFVMERKKGGGAKRKYIRPRRRK